MRKKAAISPGTSLTWTHVSLLSNNVVHQDDLKLAEDFVEDFVERSITEFMEFIIDAVVVKDFYKKFYNSLGRVPNRCSSSISKTRGLLSFSRGIVNALAGRPLGAYDLGVATPRALVYVGVMTSGDARIEFAYEKNSSSNRVGIGAKFLYWRLADDDSNHGSRVSLRSTYEHERVNVSKE
ncbi:hypothetical protein Tco_1175279 [Tanacetum coccineum]